MSKRSHIWTRREAIKSLALSASAIAFSPRSSFAGTAEIAAKKPNIILILSDDVGYGDIGSYGGTGVHTPNIDRLSKHGLRFTDTHSVAATCTPSRYSILTGAYAWRNERAQILPGDAALLIDPSKPTLPSTLKKTGYATGCVGKWHMGLGNGNIDWNGDISPGPCEVGFDYSFIIPATADRVPCVYVENHRVVGLDPKDPIIVSYRENVGTDPTGSEHPELLKMAPSEGQNHSPSEHAGTIVDGVSRIGFMSGGKSARWVDEMMAPTLVRKANAFIEKHKEERFFLYFATSDIHVPRVPNNEFVNTSACGIRCDAIEQLDWTVGQVMATLDKLGLTDNTLVIFSSDNGPVVDDGYADGSVEHLNGHKPAGEFRGGKYSIYEGGTRVPFIAHWPGHIQPGESDALLGQIDLLASLGSLAGMPPAGGFVRDSTDQLPALLGESKTGREFLVEESSVLAIRKGQWKLIDAKQVVGKGPASSGDSGGSEIQLYDLAKDPRESVNVAGGHPDIVHELSTKLRTIRDQEREAR
jgi:arylsulfatase A-like enzyme